MISFTMASRANAQSKSQGVWRQLLDNPYIFGLSAVRAAQDPSPDYLFLAFVTHITFDVLPKR